MDGLAASALPVSTGVTGGLLMPNPFAYLSSVGGIAEQAVCLHQVLSRLGFSLT
jgi:hypothetical protein